LGRSIMRKRYTDMNSFDMLLDTMCNTFGGICFIALLIAIISANLPKERAVIDEPDIRVIEQNAQMKELVRRRDELLTAIEAQERLMSQQSLSLSPLEKDLKSLRTSKIDAETRLQELQNIYNNLMKKIASIGADIKYDTEEYRRLSKLADELKLKLGELTAKNTQVARAPMKHTTSKFPIHVVLKRGKGAVLRFPKSGYNITEFEIIKQSEDITLVTPKRNFGCSVDEALVSSSLFMSLITYKGKDCFVNLITDEYSFPETCLLRDALIKEGFQYNWSCYLGNSISFATASVFDLQ